MTHRGTNIKAFGAHPSRDGVHFRVWAPGSRSVEVVLSGEAESVHPLAPEGEGYFSGIVPEARTGSRYRYRLDGADTYPDPASRCQPDGVHGPSEVVDPTGYEWQAQERPARTARDLVIYELHIGTFTPGGTFDSAIEKLPELAALGVTAVEPMPIASFPGTRNWGYDGVSLFAPAAVYGGPEGFRRFVDAAHGLGLSVILDVVYNHFGPEGNYLPAITRGHFFTDRHRTPWGDAINYDGPGSRAVRDFVIENALHWFEEYRVDGLRLDATHAIIDESPQHILAELADRVAALPGPPRILIAEDERNDPKLLTPRGRGGYGLDAVWADDLHHQLRRLTAGDSEGYFRHYTGTVCDAAATLAHGWWRRHELAKDLDPSCFIHCIQNHDQVGNRAFGERLNHEVSPPVFRALTSLLLTSPYVPLIWMGQEWGASTPFLYFTDHPGELGKLVTRGRRQEFAHFSAFSDPVAAERIPDPQAEETFARSRLQWDEREGGFHAGVLALYRELLRMRATLPALGTSERGSFMVEEAGPATLVLRRSGRDGSALLIVVNLEGEFTLDPAKRESTRAPGDSGWAFLLATEEERFGGNGAWGELGSDGMLGVRGPGGVVLRGGNRE